MVLSSNRYVKGTKKKKVSLTVQKRDGKIEPFDQEKMARAVSRAGTPFVMALDIAKTITNNKELAQKNVVNSAELRQLVTQELQNRNESTIAESYSGYSKNKVTTEIREEITSRNKNTIQRPVELLELMQSNLRWIEIRVQVVDQLVDKGTLLGDHNDLLLIVLFFSIKYLIIGSKYLNFIY